MKVVEELQSSFQGLRVIEHTVHNLSIVNSKPDLAIFKKEVENRIRKSVSIEQLKDQKVVRANRDFYWKVGIDPTKMRPAGEALTRRILGGRELPTINTFVDSYNLVSAETFVAIGAFDLDSIHADSLLMRRAVKGEKFLGIGMEREIELIGLEIVIEDLRERNLIAVCPYRDSDASKVTEDSKSVLLMMCGVPGIDEAELQRTETLTTSYVERFCV